MPSPTVSHLRARLAVAVQRQTGEAVDLRRQLDDALAIERLDRAIDQLVASAPQITSEQAARLRDLLPASAA